jgi:carbonic anhydrase
MCRDPETLNLSRRTLVAGAGLLLAASAARPAFAEAEPGKEPALNAISPSEALERLKEGNARYVSGNVEQRDCYARRTAQVEAQHPIAGVLSCADSRVPPEIIFDQGVGDLFVSRDAGNVVSDYGLASFEFAVTNLGVPLILVLGHSGCGAVATALTASTGRRELPGHLPELVKAIEPAIITTHGRHPGDFLAASIEENVRLGMKRLKTKSQIIGKAVEAGNVAIAGGLYDLKTGAVTLI